MKAPVPYSAPPTDGAGTWDDRPEFFKFSKIPRLSRDCIITEKIDGTNGQICITESNEIYVGSRNRWITVEDDNYGFARWVEENKEELLKLGEGRHFGEWWGLGIQRGYGMIEKKFSLFNIGRYKDKELPECVSVVPIIYEGLFSEEAIACALEELKVNGSFAAPLFMDPEGIIVFHKASRQLFKKTIFNDGKPKGR